MWLVAGLIMSAALGPIFAIAGASWIVEHVRPSDGVAGFFSIFLLPLIGTVVAGTIGCLVSLIGEDGEAAFLSRWNLCCSFSLVAAVVSCAVAST